MSTDSGMKEIDPGHMFELQSLDNFQGQPPIQLVFVKREGEKFPGNVGHHYGTNLQEVLRACIARIAYLDGQIPDDRNKIAAGHLGRVIFLLEDRAAQRHGRKPPSPFEAIFGEACADCGHVGCKGSCRED